MICLPADPTGLHQHQGGPEPDERRVLLCAWVDVALLESGHTFHAHPCAQRLPREGGLQLKTGPLVDQQKAGGKHESMILLAWLM